ncbi:hypothetical protein ABEB36_006090 [Hypothenemus hampei]|uniref:RRM domain-containing protein n=1 Tax=Hypothenemus hampei TaxID=57062 RepID=A0ABD1F0M5_HYPHA
MAKIKKINSQKSIDKKPVKSLKKPLNKKSSKKSSLKLNKNKVDSKSKKLDTIALNKGQDKILSKLTKKIKDGINKGSIKIKEEPKILKQKAEESRGLIYIGHIPHGFYETEMENYFKQFGKVTNVKVCRSKVSGRSKGYGFIEFKSPEVAKIAADAMNNYVMFQKRIVTEYIPYEKRPKGLFYGKSSNLIHTSVKSRRAKQKGSRNKLQDENTVNKKTKITIRKLQIKIGKLKNLGIKCNIKPVGVNESLLNSVNQESATKPTKTLKVSNPTSKKSKTKAKSNLLKKPLDSVNQIPVHSKDSEDEKTQIVNTGTKEKRPKRILKGGISKKKKDTALKLDTEAVKSIARELVKKRGNPLVNLKTNKTKAKKENKNKK